MLQNFLLGDEKFGLQHKRLLLHLTASLYTRFDLPNHALKTECIKSTGTVVDM